MAIEIVDFPSYKMVDLSLAMLVHQRVSPFYPHDIMNVPMNMSFNISYIPAVEWDDKYSWNIQWHLQKL